MRTLAAIVLCAAVALASVGDKPRGFWRMISFEMRDYCECRAREVGLAVADGAPLGLSRTLFAPGSCRVDRDALLAYARAPARLTVVVMAYLPAQNERLDALICGYAASPFIAKILLLWNGPSGRPPNATCAYGWRRRGLSYEASLSGGSRAPRLEVVIEKQNTLLNRYRHAAKCATDAVVLQDDDVFHHPETLEAFAWLHAAAPRQILGTPPERDWKVGEDGAFGYVFHPRKTPTREYSFLLGQTSVLDRTGVDAFLTRAPRPTLAYIVAHKPTCEDLSLHFFHANATGGLPPIVLNDLKPRIVMGAKTHQMHTAVSRKAWNKRRERCLNRLTGPREFGHMPLAKSACRVRGNITRVLERYRGGERGMWPHVDRADGKPAAAAGFYDGDD